MKRSWKQMVIGLCALAGGLGIASCSKEAFLQSFSGEGQQLQISLRVPANAPTSEYEAGSIYENYIDLVSGNYRIYFFDEANKFITRFEAAEVLPVEGTNYTEYTLQGEVPKDLLGHENFKVVMLANWPKYEDEDITTIENLCKAEWAQFSIPTTFVLGPDNLIPFYGVHEYSNVSFKPGVATVLEPITLLRAMAKVEVILETEEMSFSEVIIHRYNAKGYCAPSNVDSQEDYEQEGQDAEIHLPNGQNDTGASEPERLFLQESGTEQETWIAYLPEYDNVGDKAKDSYITIRFDLQTETDEKEFEIYFAQDQDMTQAFDIERNHLYRFRVSIDPKGKMKVTVNGWDDAYDNDFNF